MSPKCRIFLHIFQTKQARHVVLGSTTCRLSYFIKLVRYLLENRRHFFFFKSKKSFLKFGNKKISHGSDLPQSVLDEEDQAIGGIGVHLVLHMLTLKAWIPPKFCKL